MTLQEIINQVSSVKSSRFVSLVYRGQDKMDKAGKVVEHPDKARYLVLLGLDYVKQVKKDIQIFSGLLPRLSDETEIIACKEIIASRQKSLLPGGNPDYTNKETYSPLIDMEGKPLPGLRINRETGKLQVYGFRVKREVLESGFYKQVNSSAKTLAKKKLEKKSLASRFRPFIMQAESIEKLAINGKVLEIA